MASLGRVALSAVFVLLEVACRSGNEPATGAEGGGQGERRQQGRQQAEGRHHRVEDVERRLAAAEAELASRRTG